MLRRLTLSMALVLVVTGAPACVLIDDFDKFAEAEDAGSGERDGGPDAAFDGDTPEPDGGPDCQPETCNGEDDDCDGTVDEDPTECSFPNAVVGCVAGACEMVGCEAGFEDCTEEAGCETDPTSDPMHCGSCGNACEFGDRCAASTCSLPSIEEVLTFPSTRDASAGAVAVDASGDISTTVSFELTVDLPGETVSGGDIGRAASALLRLSSSFDQRWVHIVQADGRTNASAFARASGVSFFAGRALGGGAEFDSYRVTHPTLSDHVFVWSFSPEGTSRWLAGAWADTGIVRDAVVRATNVEVVGFGTSFEDAVGLGGQDGWSFTVREGDPPGTSSPVMHGGLNGDAIMAAVELPSGGTAYSVEFSESAIFPPAIEVNAEASDGSQAALIVPGDGEGISDWTVVIGGPGSDRAGTVTADRDGNLYWVVYPNTAIDFGDGAMSGRATPFAALVSYDREGRYRWVRVLEDVGVEALVTRDGSVVLAGALVSERLLGEDVAYGGGVSDALVASFDASNGRLRWAMRWGGFGNDRAYGAAVESDGAILVSGSYEDTVLFGSHSHTARGNRDGFLLRVRE